MGATNEGVPVPGYCPKCRRVFPSAIRISGQRVQLGSEPPGHPIKTRCPKGHPAFIPLGIFSYDPGADVLLCNYAHELSPDEWAKAAEIVYPFRGKRLSSRDIEKLDRKIEQEIGKRGVLAGLIKYLGKSKPHEYLIGIASIITAVGGTAALSSLNVRGIDFSHEQYAPAATEQVQPAAPPPPSPQASTEDPPEAPSSNEAAPDPSPKSPG